MTRSWKILIATAVSFLLVSLPTALADDDNADDDGAIVLSSYHVSTNVNSRLATTSIDMVFENHENCTSVYGLTLQLPLNARVTELVMDLSDGCQMTSQVKDLEQAEKDFEEFHEEGKAAAILTAWDMANYELQVSIPPEGTTSVTLKFQELLAQKLNLVSFQVPMFPGMAVDDLIVDVAVEDPNLVNGFDTEFKDEMVVTSLEAGRATMHYETREVTKDTALPTLFRADFTPGLPPEEGLFLSNGECFTHIFNPEVFLSSLGSMARRIVFVIDVSGSMTGQKLEDVKASFVLMIDTLTERDSLVLQTFSTEGTESLWGPNPATESNKEDAERFVNGLETIGGTNLNGALLDGIDYVRDAPETVAPVVVIMTDGRGMNPGNVVARNVRERNEGRKVKIFSLAFGNDADMDLLLGIAIQNGGKAVRIYEGFGDAAYQMELFYKQELGSILMSDINVSYDFGDVNLSDSTTSSFPILAAGSEIVVRGKMASSVKVDGTSRSLQSIVSATSARGPIEWPVDHIVVPDESTNSDCRQSFAQARIMELLEYRDATRSIGDELLVGAAVSRTANLETSSFEEEARKVALDAGLVWPGLTALVTVESPFCQQKISDVCYRGVGNGNDLDYFYADEAGQGGNFMRSSTSSGAIWSSKWGSISSLMLFASSLLLMLMF